jgi:hypothetical protein
MKGQNIYTLENDDDSIDSSSFFFVSLFDDMVVVERERDRTRIDRPAGIQLIK